MQKNLLIVALILITAASLIFSFYQQSLAEASRRTAEAQEKVARDFGIKAQEAQRMAEEQRRMAEANAMEAMQQRQLAEEELRKCRGRK